MQRDYGATVSLGLSRKSLEAKRVFACRKCLAPGIYSADPKIRDGWLSTDSRTRSGWPKCYSPIFAGQPVGDLCPQCGSIRPIDDPTRELTSSIPDWLWKGVLAFKWVLVRFFAVKRYILG